MRLTNVVLGENASASRSVIWGLYVPAFSTQYIPAGQFLAPPKPIPDFSTRAGTWRTVSMPMPSLSAVAAVKILNTDPAPLPSVLAVSGRTVSKFSASSP